MFEEILSLRPYFYSLREIKENSCLDMRYPNTWKYDISESENVSIKMQDSDNKTTLISIISNASENGYGLIFKAAKEIIRYNKEQEERAILFQEKIEQLKDLFMNAPIDRLKEINFISKDGQKDSTGIGVVE